MLDNEEREILKCYYQDLKKYNRLRKKDPDYQEKYLMTLKKIKYLIRYHYYD